MASSLGKRKRAKAEAEEKRGDSTDSDIDAQEIFRRHFEARFKPLPTIPKAKTVAENVHEDDDTEDPDWEGISDEEVNAVQVVEHTDIQSKTAAMSKEELKAFMSSKVPKSGLKKSLLSAKLNSSIDEDDATEAANLKKDLALQRLLAESHLLESAKNPTLSGNNRHKATDLRLQALGAKTSVLKQAKMPLAHRRGMVAKQNEREEFRRREAKENGIILEKAKLGLGSKKGSDRKRDRGVGAPTVGKFSGGTLKLSKKDVFSIEGPKRDSAGKGGRGSGRGGGRGRGKRGR